MLRLLPWLLATACVLVVVSPTPAVDLLLNSWETPDDPGTDPTNGGVDAPGDPNYNFGAREELEGWEDSFGTHTDPASVSVVSGAGNTEGASALQFTLTENDFEWSVNRFLETADPQYADFVTALENPAFHEISYDLTYDLTFSAPDDGSFFNIGISISTLEGSTDVFHQGFGLFGVGSDVITAAPGGNITGTATVGQNLASFSNQPFDTSNLGFIRPIIPVNGNWDAPATFIIDNLRISQSAPPQDLDGDLDVDLDDFDEFMMWHKSDFTGLTAEQAAARGDFDGDFDSDFADFLSFEAVFDQLSGGPGSLKLALSTPEPGALILVLVGLAACVGVRRRKAKFVAIGAAALLLATPQAANALTVDLLESWESGLNGWSTSISNGSQVSGGASLATSATGATEGSMSLAITQSSDTFDLDPLFNSSYSYNAEVRYSPGSTQLDALNTAFDVGATHYELHLDVTFDAASIPSGTVSVGIGLEGSGAAFNTVQNLATTAVPSSGSTTVSIAEPLTNWNVPQSGNATFFDISFGLNSNWGSVPATVFFDNLELVQVSEPALLTLEIDRSDGSTLVKNENAPGNPVEFNYYEIVSGTDALNPTGWESLDENQVPDDGWIAAGGANPGDLTEANLQSSSTLDGGNSFDLGSAFSVGGSESDLAFRYREPTRPGALRTGLISFIGDSPLLDGDYNNDGSVDAIDYAVWREALASGDPLLNETASPGTADSADYDAWKANFGASSMSATATATPEPAALLLVLLSLALVSFRRVVARTSSV